jgi:hypothetical protein
MKKYIIHSFLMIIQDNNTLFKLRYHNAGFKHYPNQ